MYRIAEFERRKYSLINRLEDKFDDGEGDLLVAETEDLINDLMWDLEEKTEEVEELNNYIDKLRGW